MKIIGQIFFLSILGVLVSCEILDDDIDKHTSGTSGSLVCLEDVATICKKSVSKSVKHSLKKFPICS